MGAVLWLLFICPPLVAITQITGHGAAPGPWLLSLSSVTRANSTYYVPAFALGAGHAKINKLGRCLHMVDK